MKMAKSAAKIDRERAGRLQAFAEFKQILVLCSNFIAATVALPILFFNNIFHIKLAKDESIINLINKQPHSFLLYASWFSFGVSIYYIYKYFVDSGYYVYRMNSSSDPNEHFDGEGKPLEQSLNRCFDRALKFSVGGFVSLLIFILTFKK